MSDSNSLEDDHDALWEKFDILAKSGEESIRRHYDANGTSFIEHCVAQMFVDPGKIDIQDRNEYVHFVTGLRDNYQQWNQALVRILAGIQTESIPNTSESLNNFANTCPWLGLIEVARNVANER